MDQSWHDSEPEQNDEGGSLADDGSGQGPEFDPDTRPASNPGRSGSVTVI